MSSSRLTKGGDALRLSFEFFPTQKNPEKLYHTIERYKMHQPEYISITYGAGGSTRDRTQACVQHVQQSLKMSVAAHLTCVNHTQEDIDAILTNYHTNGVTHILALRGDVPKNTALIQNPGFEYARDLVSFIRQRYPHFKIGVAGFPEGHPKTPNRLDEMSHLAEKVAAGADYICTQLFFHNDDFYDFEARCRLSGIQVPIIPGIMPILSLNQYNRMAELAAGSRYPAPLQAKIRSAKDDKAIADIGIQWTIDQARELIQNGHHHIHFYTLNQFDSIDKIIQAL